MSLRLPYSVRKYEQLTIEPVIYNYGHRTLQVSAADLDRKWEGSSFTSVSSALCSWQLTWNRARVSAPLVQPPPRPSLTSPWSRSLPSLSPFLLFPWLPAQSLLRYAFMTQRMKWG